MCHIWYLCAFLYKLQTYRKNFLDTTLLFVTRGFSYYAFFKDDINSNIFNIHYHRNTQFQENYNKQLIIGSAVSIIGNIDFFESFKKQIYYGI